MGNNSVPKFIFRLSRFPVYGGSVLGRFYCICPHIYVYVVRLFESHNQQIDSRFPAENPPILRPVCKTARNDYLLRHICPPVCPSVLPSAWNNSVAIGKTKKILKIWFLSVLRKSVERIEISLKSDNNGFIFMGRPLWICQLSITVRSQYFKIIRYIT